MKLLLVALILASAVLVAPPANAHIVQATSSLSLADLDVDDKPQLEAALKSAVRRVLTETIAFTPTFVALTDAQVIGERLYFRVLVADEEGERALAELHGQEPPEGERDRDKVAEGRITL